MAATDSSTSLLRMWVTMAPAPGITNVIIIPRECRHFYLMPTAPATTHWLVVLVIARKCTPWWAPWRPSHATHWRKTTPSGSWRANYSLLPVHSPRTCDDPLPLPIQPCQDTIVLANPQHLNNVSPHFPHLHFHLPPCKSQSTYMTLKPPAISLRNLKWPFHEIMLLFFTDCVDRALGSVCENITQ